MTDWFNTDRSAGVYLLDARYGIVYRTALPFNRYTSTASWAYVSIPDIIVPEEFYVLVEPVSRPYLKLNIGYDSSGVNQASFFGTPGAMLNWATEAPEESTNWMIRVEYE